MIRALIADDHPIMREGLKLFLVCNLDIHVDEVEDGFQAIDYVKNNELDILILDISMPGLDGLDTLKEVRDIKPDLPVLMLSAYSEDQYAMRVLKAGANGYLMKTSATDELVDAVQKILEGGKYLSPSVADKLVDAVSTGTQQVHHSLSDREFEVMRMIATGKTLTQIGEELKLSIKTVSTYRTRILEKTGFEDNAAITSYVIKNGLLPISALP
ncbi:MAG: response regulator transcription factor [Candidatus Kapabacteria bacterium]|nr:response regulator transcription factor [Candidatus Kapabacteria bacterium]